MDRDWDFTKRPPSNFFEHLALGFQKVFVRPVRWFRETVIDPNRQEYNYYHRQYRRVPTIDQCYQDDWLCKWEADMQLIRDYRVESYMLILLRDRYDDCIIYEGDIQPQIPKCFQFFEDYMKASGDWFCKYGELGFNMDAYKALMKQKHRLVWERRHGPVGTGMREKKIREDGTIYYK